MEVAPVEVFVAVLAVAFFAIWLTLQIVKDIRNRAGKELCVEAVLNSKHEEDYMTQQVFLGRGKDEPVREGLPEKRRMYVLVFRDDELQEYTFEVDKSVYDRAEEGTRELLNYRGNRFISFGRLKAVPPKARGGYFISMKDK